MASTNTVLWTDAVAALAAVATPVVVVAIGYLISRRLKRLEDQQWRGRALIDARLGYYREIAEPINDLMSYFTFIGSWKDFSPPEIIKTKRRVDKTFHTLAPFFSELAGRAYETFMNDCFSTFGNWGADARLKTGFARRKDADPSAWNDDWNDMFVAESDGAIPPETLLDIRRHYNELLAVLVDDIQLTSSRPDYASARVSLNAH